MVNIVNENIIGTIDSMKCANNSITGKASFLASLLTKTVCAEIMDDEMMVYTPQIMFLLAFSFAKILKIEE